jgi:RNA polymerase sigma-70 factor (ECF subfamily)
MTNPTLPAALREDAPSGELQRVPEEQIFDLVYRQMRSLVGGRERDFDDLVQDAMEQALRSLSAFEGRSKLSTWTYQICYRTVLKRRRWYGRWLKRFTLTHSGELPEQVTQRQQPSRRIDRAEEKQRLADALSKLSTKKRLVVTLHDMEGMASEEISEIIGVKLGTVRSRLRDGRKDLLALLADDPYFGERVAT